MGEAPWSIRATITRVHHVYSMKIALCVSSPSRTPRSHGIITWPQQLGIARNCTIWHGKSWKSRLFMASTKYFIFWAQNFRFWTRIFHKFYGKLQNFHILNAEFLPVCLKAPLQFLSAKFAFSERRILGCLFRGVFECKICIFWQQNVYFSSQNFEVLAWNLHFRRTEFAFSAHGILECMRHVLTVVDWEHLHPLFSSKVRKCWFKLKEQLLPLLCLFLSLLPWGWLSFWADLAMAASLHWDRWRPLGACLRICLWTRWPCFSVGECCNGSLWTVWGDTCKTNKQTNQNVNSGIQ